MKIFSSRIFNVEHLMICAGTFLLVGTLVFISFNISFLNPVAHAIQEFSLSDLYYKVAWQDDAPPAMSDDITLVDITPLHDRAEIGDVLVQIHECHPKVIGVDVIFERESEDVTGDLRLLEAVSDAPEAVYAYKLTDFDATNGSFKNEVKSFFVSDETKMGYANAVGSMSSTCLRELSVERNLNGRKVPSFTFSIAQQYRSDAQSSSMRDDRLINFRYLDFPVVSYDSIAAHSDLLRNRIVLLGTLGEEQDMHFTPLGKMSGLKVQGYAIQTLIDQRNIVTVSNLWLWTTAIVVCYLTILWQYFWMRYIDNWLSPIGVFIASSKILLRLLIFIWLAVLVWLSYLFYERLDVYIPMAVILTLVILVPEARGIYLAIAKLLDKTWPGKFFKKSIYL